jgi:hypothetical protein
VVATKQLRGIKAAPLMSAKVSILSELASAGVGGELSKIFAPLVGFWSKLFSQSDFLALFGISSVVVTPCSFAQEAHSSRPAFTLSLAGDEPLEVKIKVVFRSALMRKKITFVRENICPRKYNGRRVG